MDAEDTQHDPLRDAREAALRRIGEMRQRNLGAGEPAGPDLRTLLARSERHVDELRRTASELAAILPTRVEAAVARALGEDEGGLGRRLDTSSIAAASSPRQSSAWSAICSRSAWHASRISRCWSTSSAAGSAHCEPICAPCGGSWPSCRPSSASLCTSRSRASRAPSRLPRPPPRRAPALRMRASVEDAPRAPSKRSTPTHPDTPSSHPRLDPSRPPPRSWRHAGTRTGKRRVDRAAGGGARAGVCARRSASCASGRRSPRRSPRLSPGAFAPGSRRRRPRRRSSRPCSPARRALMPTARRCSTCGRAFARTSPARGRCGLRRERAAAVAPAARREGRRPPAARIEVVDRATEDAWLRSASTRDCSIARPSRRRLREHARRHLLAGRGRSASSACGRDPARRRGGRSASSRSAPAAGCWSFGACRARPDRRLGQDACAGARGLAMTPSMARPQANTPA